MTDQTPTATDEVVDFTPERCAFTSTPDGAPRFRCTATAAEEHAHHWNSDEQERWTDETRAVLLEAMDRQRAIDDQPCPVCGGDRLRPDFTGSGRCHA